MPVILGSILLAVLIAVGAGMAFLAVQRPVYEAQPLPSVRVGDPGHNLVGPQWTGNGSADRSGATSNRAEADATGARPH
jgi:hypothetical protein